MTQTLLRYGWSQGELKWKPLNPADCYTDRKEENITAMRCTIGKGPQTRHVGKPPPSLSKPTAAPLLPVSEGLGTFSAESLEALGAFCFLGTTLPAVLSTLDVDLGRVHRNALDTGGEQIQLPSICSLATSLYHRPRGWGHPEIALSLWWEVFRAQKQRTHFLVLLSGW